MPPEQHKMASKESPKFKISRFWTTAFLVLVFLTYGIFLYLPNTWSFPNRPFVEPMDFVRVRTPYEVSKLQQKRPDWKERLILEAGQGPIAGSEPSGKKFLTIGISTVYREEGYLKRTLESLLNQSWTEERQWAVIVLFLADTDEELRDLQLKLILDNFQMYLDSGFIQVTAASSSIYPSFDFALRRRTYNDTVDRVIWRTKQVLDFAFLFSYVRSHDLSEYHVVLEDDLLASNQYLTAIRDFVSLKTRDGSVWTALQFTTFLGIGLLFKTKDLDRLTEFLLVFHKEHPVDGLMKMFTGLENPGIKNEGVVLRKPSTFQHIGKKSTLPNKVQNLVDNTFGKGKRQFEDIRNPIALRISTTLNIRDDFVPENAYSPAPGWFSGISSMQEDKTDTFDIIYENVISVERIVVLSGYSEGGNKIAEGTLLIGSNLEEINPIGTSNACSDMNVVETFKNGNIDVTLNETKAQCIQIQLRSQRSLIVIREIKVFETAKTLN